MEGGTRVAGRYRTVKASLGAVLHRGLPQAQRAVVVAAVDRAVESVSRAAVQMSAVFNDIVRRMADGRLPLIPTVDLGTTFFQACGYGRVMKLSAPSALLVKTVLDDAFTDWPSVRPPELEAGLGPRTAWRGMGNIQKAAANTYQTAVNNYVTFAFDARQRAHVILAICPVSWACMSVHAAPRGHFSGCSGIC